MKNKKIKYLLFSLCLVCVAFIIPKQAVQAKASYTIYVNRKTNIVNVVNNSTKKVVRAMYCSTGKRYGTISGTYHTTQKLRWHALYGGVYGQYCTRIHGPYLFHSVPYYRTKNSAVETKEYNTLGKQSSMGCVRLAVVDVKWIYDNCRLGTKVVIGEKKKLKKPTRNLLKISTKKKAGWDPTDPNPNNPYYPVLILKSSKYQTIKKNAAFDPKAVIKVSSDFTAADKMLSLVKVTGMVNTSKTGIYTLKYSVKDPATLLKKTLTVKFKVVE